MLAEAPGGVKRKGGDAPAAQPSAVVARWRSKNWACKRGVDAAAGTRDVRRVNDPPDQPARPPAPKAKPATGPDRETRLAAALRDNLRRRKAGGGKAADEA